MRSLAVLAAILLVASSAAVAEEPAPQVAGSAAQDPEGAISEKASPRAEASDEGEEAAREFEASLSFKTGDVLVGDQLATIHLGSEMRFLGAEDTEKVLVAWGNPPGSQALGMVVPSKLSLFDGESWAVIVSYLEDGHVEDEDAKELDYAEILSEMKEETEQENAARKEAGFPSAHLLGWAEPPHYDAGTRKLYWAKELSFEGSEQHTLNYDIRVLGRKGVLQLSAVASMGQLSMVKAEMPKVLGAVEFNPGNRYADFKPDVDKVAAYGIGALVAGKLAAKAGLFKVILAALLASKKLLAAAAVGLVVALKKLFGRRSGEDAASGTG